ncbi:hypothetical protein JMJ35_004879 [Cladonia borealis]|uniref:Uncharacterized protein n=1 Tax=Cladonia borealis TaxID=184061 RepID=A0AA39V240_9LECA|nr:hypothetical protein JMJ35_004879 [Cladonia borealis]
MFAKQSLLFFTLLIASCLVWAQTYDQLVNSNTVLAGIISQDDDNVESITVANGLENAPKVTEDVQNIQGHIQTVLKNNQGITPSDNAEQEDTLVNSFDPVATNLVDYMKDLTAKEDILALFFQQDAIYQALENVSSSYTSLYRYENSLLETPDIQNELTQSYANGLTAVLNAIQAFEPSTLG